MFAIDSAGSSFEEKFSDYDKNKVDKCKKSIEFKENANFVKLPWNEDKIKSVPSNHQVALKVLDRTILSLEKKKLDKTYNDIVHQQEHDRKNRFRRTGLPQIHLDTSQNGL